MLALLLLILVVPLCEQRKHQEETASCIGTCQKEFPFAYLEDQRLILEKIKNVTDSVMKESMLSIIKSTTDQMEDIPKIVKDKLKDEKFLKEKIDLVIEKKFEEIEMKIKPPKEEEKEEVSKTSTETSSTTANYKWAPYGGQARINDWHDFYRYFPHLANKVRLWKLEFKEAALKNDDKFGGCANPAKVVDWLVPDIEEVKKDQLRKKYKY